MIPAKQSQEEATHDHPILLLPLNYNQPSLTGVLTMIGSSSTIDILMLTKAYLKNRVLVQCQGGAAFQPAGALKEVPLGCILKVVEDLKRGTNAEIRIKSIFEMAFT